MVEKIGLLSLQFYWYEMKPGEEAMTWWGQLAGAMHRLMTIRENLEGLQSKRNVQKGLRRLESHVESFFLQAYELRERTLGLLAARTNQPKIVQKLKHSQHRNDALSSLKLIDAELTQAVGNLLPLVDQEIGLRNMHTHQFYLSLGLVTESSIHDPYDALLDFPDHSDGRGKLEALLRRELKKTAKYYADKSETLIRAIKGVLTAGDTSAGAPKGKKLFAVK